MKSMKNVLATVLALVTLLSMFAACGDNSSSQNGGDSSDKNISVGTMYSHLYFFSAGSGESDNFCRRLVYDQLFYIDNITGEMSSSILADYAWEDDVTLKLTLKDGILFSDGTQMTAEDILYTLEAYVTNGNSEIEFFQRINFDSSRVSDDGLTVYVVYNEVYGPALSTLCVPVLSKAFCEAHPDGDDAWWYSPIGSGPYTVGNVEMGTSIEFVRRSDYWDSAATYEADTITIKYYSDSTTQYADYVAGELDIIFNLSSTQVDELSLLDNTEIVVQSANDVCYLVFNERSIQPEVRKAIAYAVDWDAVGVAAYENLCTTATSHYATTFDAYTDHGKVYEYNPEKAKQILEDAGITSLTVSMPAFANSGSVKMGEMIQFYLAEVGITVEVNSMDVATLIPAMINGEGDISGSALEVTGNAAKEVNTVLSTFGADGFKIMAISDEAFNDLLNQGLATVNPDERNEIYRQVDQWLYDNYQAIPVCERSEAYCYNTEKIASMSLASVLRVGFDTTTFK